MFSVRSKKLTDNKLNLGPPHATTIFTQCAPEATEFGEITQNKGDTPFKVIRGHRFWYQSKAHNHIKLHISD